MAVILAHTFPDQSKVFKSLKTFVSMIKAIVYLEDDLFCEVSCPSYSKTSTQLNMTLQASLSFLQMWGTL